MPAPPSVRAQAQTLIDGSALAGPRIITVESTTARATVANRIQRDRVIWALLFMNRQARTKELSINNAYVHSIPWFLQYVKGELRAAAILNL
jgi:uncharacterized protein YicC (UPF0701 family)